MQSIILNQIKISLSSLPVWIYETKLTKYNIPAVFIDNISVIENKNFIANDYNIKIEISFIYSNSGSKDNFIANSIIQAMENMMFQGYAFSINSIKEEDILYIDENSKIKETLIFEGNALSI